MICRGNNQNCQTCFECRPCVGPTYSRNNTAENCSLCSENHWGNNPLSGSTHCVPVKVKHLDYSNGWSIVSMCIASIALIILTVIIVIFAINWNTPVVKSSGREQVVMLFVGIGICCILTFIIASGPSIYCCMCVPENWCVVLVLSSIWCSFGQDYSCSSNFLLNQIFC